MIFTDIYQGVKFPDGSSLENLRVHIVLHRRVTKATNRCQAWGTVAKLSPLSQECLYHRSVDRANLSEFEELLSDR